MLAARAGADYTELHTAPRSDPERLAVIRADGAPRLISQARLAKTIWRMLCRIDVVGADLNRRL